LTFCQLAKIINLSAIITGLNLCYWMGPKWTTYYYQAYLNFIAFTSHIT